MDYWNTSDADDRRGGRLSNARRWAGHVGAFVAGVAITSLVAFLVVHGRSTDAVQLSVGGSTDTTDSALSTTTTPPSVAAAPSTVDTIDSARSTTTPPSVESVADNSPAPTTTAPAETPSTASPRSEPAPASTASLAEGDALATCTEPEHGVASTPTMEEFVGRLEGTWLVCDAPSVFGTNEVGMQIRNDGRWSKLSRNPTGQLTAMRGWGNEGTWETIDASGMNQPGVFQVDFHIDGSGTVISLPVFSSGPPKMRLNNMGIYVADYVPISDELVLSEP